MKVLICARGYNSIHGCKAGLFELDQAKALKKAGCDVRIAAPDIRSFRHLRKPGKQRYTADGIEVYTLNMPLGTFAWRSSRLLDKAAEKCYRFVCGDGWKPDVMHGHFSGKMFAGVAKDEQIPFVITEHSSSVMRKDLPEKYTEKISEDYRGVDEVIAVSSALATRISEISGRRPSVVPNIVDAELFECTDRAAGENREKIFLSAGNLKKGKGMDVLLEAFHAFTERKDTDPGTKLIIMGGGAEEEALRKQAEDLGIADRVTFTGRFKREEFAGALHEADAFVLASRGETFGVVYVEAMMAGVPVIATACGGPEDFVTEETGLIIPKDDPAALADALAYMDAHAKDYDRRAVSSYAREKFSPDAVARQLLDIYERMTEKSRAEL